jgi:hypothetical protein
MRMKIGIPLTLTLSHEGAREKIISFLLPLFKEIGIKKIKVKRLPRHFVPRNDELEFLLP